MLPSFSWELSAPSKNGLRYSPCTRVINRTIGLRRTELSSLALFSSPPPSFPPSLHLTTPCITSPDIVSISGPAICS